MTYVSMILPLLTPQPKEPVAPLPELPVAPLDAMQVRQRDPLVPLLYLRLSLLLVVLREGTRSG
jgi:hypothetical protein